MWNISVLKKLPFNYAIILLLPVILFCNTSFASCVPSAPITVPGTSKTIYVSRDDTDPILRGDYELSTLTITMNCYYDDDSKAYVLSTKPSGSLSPLSPFGSDFSGNTTVVLSGGGLGLEVYEIADGHPPVWFGNFSQNPGAGFPASKTFNVTFGVDLVSVMGGSVTAGEHTFSGKYGELWDDRSGGDLYNVNMGNFSVFVILTGCQLNTNQANLTWDSLSSQDILSGEVSTRMAEVGADCGQVETPVSIKFTSSHGYVNAAQGIVRTDDDGSNNMGLQLSWEKNGQPIEMDKTTHDTVKGTQQFNVVAKPVAINPKNSIKSGTYNGTVTMMFSYR
ncbi:fimbrial protein [Enterobacteriaceae bacterium Kacie_13]|nr:fimbrial protein [Enterobacteriaceae bacterium Kacie_13]